MGNHKGLNLIEGVTKHFPKIDTQGSKLKVPQIGWNQIFKPYKNAWDKSPLKVCRDGDFVYFVHSYYVIPAVVDYVISTTKYGGLEYCSSIQKKNIFACQFHPEKSATQGLEIYKSFLEFKEDQE